MLNIKKLLGALEARSISIEYTGIQFGHNKEILWYCAKDKESKGNFPIFERETVEEIEIKVKHLRDSLKGLRHLEE